MRKVLAVLAAASIVVGVVNFAVAVADPARASRLSVFITHPLAIAGLGYFLFQSVFPRFVYRVPREALAARAGAVRRSGSPLAALRCGGDVGPLELRGPLLRAVVFPAGMVIEPIFLAPCAVLAAEIAAVAIERRWGERGVVITHTSAHVASPLCLRCAPDDPFVAAVRAIAPDAG